MTAPTWILASLYWLHMLATVIWIGGLAILVILILPIAAQVLEARAYIDLFSKLQKRFDPLAWFCLALLAATGMFQMSANPNYHGLLAIDNRWAVAILLKHILYASMIIPSAVNTWILTPKLRRAALRRTGSEGSQLVIQLQKQALFLMRLNLAAGILILGMTALARVA